MVVKCCGVEYFIMHWCLYNVSVFVLFHLLFCLFRSVLLCFGVFVSCVFVVFLVFCCLLFLLFLFVLFAVLVPVSPGCDTLRRHD